MQVSRSARPALGTGVIQVIRCDVILASSEEMEKVANVPVRSESGEGLFR